MSIISKKKRANWQASSEDFVQSATRKALSLLIKDQRDALGQKSLLLLVHNAAIPIRFRYMGQIAVFDVPVLPLLQHTKG